MSIQKTCLCNSDRRNAAQTLGWTEFSIQNVIGKQVRQSILITTYLHLTPSHIIKDPNGCYVSASELSESSFKLHSFLLPTGRTIISQYCCSPLSQTWIPTYSYREETWIVLWTQDMTECSLLPQTLSALMDQYGSVHPLRFLQPYSTKYSHIQYTIFSNIRLFHSSCSCMDYIIVDKTLRINNVWAKRLPCLYCG